MTGEQRYSIEVLLQTSMSLREIAEVIGFSKCAIMTTYDRCTHLVLIRRLEGKEAAPLADAATEALPPYKDKIHTITADNGKGICPS